MSYVYDESYWTNKGKHQRLYDRLHKALVPGEGAASTEAGELLRLAGNVYYDVYNNGGCNLVDGGREDQLGQFEGLVKSYGFTKTRPTFRKIRGYAARDEQPGGRDDGYRWDDDLMEDDVTIDVLFRPLEDLMDFCIERAERLSRRKAA